MPDAGVHENSILRTAPAVCIYKLRIGRAIPIWKERDPTRLGRRKEGENQTRPWEEKKKKKRKKKEKGKEGSILLINPPTCCYNIQPEYPTLSLIAEHRQA